MRRYGPEMVPVDKLPKSLFPTGIVYPLGELNPEELDRLCLKPQTTIPMPEQWDEKKKRQMRGLAQFSGRTPEGLRRSLANLPRKIKMEDQDPIATTPVPEMPGLMIPTPPTMVPKVPAHQTITGKYLRRICSQDESRLFDETYKKWINAHPEWTDPEDEDDLVTICLETVIMMRLQAVVKQHPTADITEAYNQSYRRKQQARENLRATRKDKTNPKGRDGKRLPDVSIWAGEFSPQHLANQTEQDIEDGKKAEEAFLKRTSTGGDKLQTGEQD